jgi:hypothetical protein
MLTRVAGHLQQVFQRRDADLCLLQLRTGSEYAERKLVVEAKKTHLSSLFRKDDLCWGWANMIQQRSASYMHGAGRHTQNSSVKPSA